MLTPSMSSGQKPDPNQHTVQGIPVAGMPSGGAYIQTGLSQAMKAVVLSAPPLPLREGENVSQALKDHITESALGLLEEQVQARIIHYKAELETNPELDAITAQVVAQVKQLQASVIVPERVLDRESIKASHEQIMRRLLTRVFRPDTPSLLVERRLKEMHRKLARLYFQSELHEKTRGQEGLNKVIHHGEQAIYYLLVRYENRLRNELDGFEYESPDIKERAVDLLTKISKEMQDAFLARRSNELKRIVSVFHAILVDFFCKQLAPRVDDFSREVVNNAQSWDGKYAYKVTSDGFAKFRISFERAFMVRLVSFAEDQLVVRLADTAGSAREETIQFITNPAVFSMICGEFCEALYEFLCNEGFLDLPSDWRQATASP
jgi:hypothetical protein